MKYLFILLLFLPLSAFAQYEPLVKKGADIQSVSPDTELGDLVHVFNIDKDTIAKIDNLDLPLEIDNTLVDTPFLYFFNGVIPKDRRNPKVWYFDGHYMTLEKFAGNIKVNNIYNCSSLKIAPTKDHLVCHDGIIKRKINFDGTTRDSKSTGNICPTQGTKTALYGNCLISMAGNKVRCTAEVNWAGIQGMTFSISCEEIEIEGDTLYCRRDRIKNSETVELLSKCLTDSSVLVTPEVFDASRFQDYFNEKPSPQLEKEPPTETRSK